MKLSASLIALSTALIGAICFMVSTEAGGNNNVRRVRVEGSDGTIYTVNTPDAMKAVELLEEMNRRCLVLIKNLPKDHILRKRYSPNNLAESPIRTDSSSWSVDKRKIFLCLRDRQTGMFYEPDVLFFVVVHELAHLASKSYGHNQEFIANFTELKSLAFAMRLMVVPPNISVPYCGTVIYDKNDPS